MRCISLVLLLIALAVGAALGDDSAMSGESGNPQLMKEHPSIQMVREDVTINPVTQKVTARFVFHNSGPATTVLMGFPEHDSGDAGFSSNHPRFPENKFVSLIDGVKVQVSPIVRPGEWAIDNYTVWWTKSVYFAAGQTRIVDDNYSGGGGDIATGNKWFNYVLKSGASWNGPIGRAVITCDMSGLPYSPIDISPPGYTHVGDKIVWDMQNVKPKEDISLYWYPAFMDVVINGVSVSDQRLKALDVGSTVYSGVSPSEVISWDYDNWTPVPAVRRGTDIWVPAKAAAIWLGGSFQIVTYDTVVRDTVGSHWIQATVGSKVLKTDRGTVTMLYPCAHENSTTPAHPGGGATMVSLSSVVSALGGKYEYDPNTNKAVVALPR